MLSVGEPNYGLAMRQGILEARGRYVICDEIDLLDTEFYARAMALLERSDTDLVVGSKAMVGSNDQRPLFRRAATRVYNGMLRVVCRFPGTDTHGLKAFRRDALLETARRCMLDRDVFASEFVIRAHREGKKVVEIPFAVREKRPPSIRLVKRVPARRQERREAGDLGPPQQRLSAGPERRRDAVVDARETRAATVATRG